METKATAPQNDYRSYGPSGVYTTQPQIQATGVATEKLSHQEMIARANGGTPSLDQMISPVGKFVSDGN